MRPLLLRPPLFLSGARRLFSGSAFVMSSKAATERWRCPGVTGLSLRIAMSGSRFGHTCRWARGPGGFAPRGLHVLEEVDLAAGERDDRLLVGRLLALDEAATRELATPLATDDHRP